MNVFDIFIIIVVSFGLLRGFFRGFIKEAASIVGIVAGFYGAFTYYELLSAYLNPLVNDWGVSNWQTYGNIASFFILFFVIIIITSLIANMLRYLLKIVFLGWVDKLFGIVFGAVKGILLAAVVFTVLTAFLPGEPKFLAQSALSPYVMNITEMATIFIPADLKVHVKNRIERIKQIWEQQKVSVRQKMTDAAKEQMKSQLQQSTINNPAKGTIEEQDLLPEQPKQ